MSLNDWDVSFDDGHIIALTRKKYDYVIYVRRGYFSIFKYEIRKYAQRLKRPILQIYDKEFFDLPNLLAQEISSPEIYGKKYLTILQKYSILVCNNDLLT